MPRMSSLCWRDARERLTPARSPPSPGSSPARSSTPRTGTAAPTATCPTSTTWITATSQPCFCRFKVLFKDEEDTLALVFQHINPEDAGLYTCVASTSTGKISCSAELSVEGGVTQLLKVNKAQPSCWPARPFVNNYRSPSRPKSRLPWEIPTPPLADLPCWSSRWEATPGRTSSGPRTARRSQLVTVTSLSILTQSPWLSSSTR